MLVNIIVGVQKLSRYKDLQRHAMVLSVMEIFHLKLRNSEDGRTDRQT